MAIGTAAALIGSAVIGAGASVYAGSQAKNAANKAQNAQDRAAEQQLQLQRDTLAKAEALQGPFIQGGYAGWDKLLQELGVQPQGQPGAGGQPQPGGQTTSAPYVPATPRPDGNGYFAANPDVQAEFQRNMASGKGREYLASLGADTPEGFAQYHYNTFGKNEGRQLPMTQPQAQTPAPAPQTAAPTGPAQPQPGRDLMTALRPASTPAPTFTRPDAVQAPTFTRPTGPSAPGMPTFDFASIENDPGYQWELNETLDGVNASSAARGKLRSGDAARALAKEASGLSHRFTNDYFGRQMAQAQMARDDYRYETGRSDANFNSDRAFGTDAYRYEQGRNDNIFADDRAYGTGLWQYQNEDADRDFETDRAYQTNRYDTNIGNLFNLAQMGQGAAGAVTGAQSNYANNAGNIFGSKANAAADAAYQKGAANAGVVGGIAGAASNLFANWGGKAQPSDLGRINYGSSLSTYRGAF